MDGDPGEVLLLGLLFLWAEMFVAHQRDTFPKNTHCRV